MEKRIRNYNLQLMKAFYMICVENKESCLTNTGQRKVRSKGKQIESGGRKKISSSIEKPERTGSLSQTTQGPISLML